MMNWTIGLEEMLLNELFKIWGNFKRCAVIGIVILLNLVYLIITAYNGQISPEKYKEYISTINSENLDAEFVRIENEIQETDESISTFEDADGVADGIGLSFSERRLYESVEEEISDIYNYKQYLDDVKSSAVRYKTISFISGYDEKTYKIISYSDSIYSKLDDITPSYTKTRGLTYGLTGVSTLFAGIILAVYYGMILTIKEKEEKTFGLIRTTGNGRSMNMVIRQAAILISIVFSEAVIIISSVITGCALYGFPVKSFWTKPLQSLYGFKTAAIKINIAEFIIFIFIGICIVGYTLSLIAQLFAILFKKATIFFILISILIGIEAYFYLNIKNYSKYVYLKNINLMAFCNVPEIIGKFKLILIGGKVINYMYLVCILTLFLMAFAFFLLILTTEKTNILISTGRKDSDVFARLKLHAGCHGISLMHEVYKAFISGGCLVIMIIGFIISFYCINVKSETFGEVSDVYYKTYIKELEGPLTDETYDKLETLQAEADSIASTMSGTERETALDKVNEYVNYLEEHENASIVYSKGYEVLCFDKYKNIIMACICFTITILCTAAVFWTDFSNGMDKITRTTWHGRKRALTEKYVILLIIVIVSFGFTYLRYASQIFTVYGKAQLQSQADSMMQLEGIGYLSIEGYLVCIGIKRLAGILISLLITSAIIKKTRSYVITVISSLAICIIPMTVALTNVDFSKYILLNWFML